MWNITEPGQRLRLAARLPTASLGVLLVLTSLGVGGTTWQDGANLLLDFFTRPEPLLFLWGLPALLLFAILGLLHRTLTWQHEGWRRLSIVAVGAAVLVGFGVAARGASHPLMFFNGLLLFSLPLLLCVLIVIQVLRWVGEGFAGGKEEVSP